MLNSYKFINHINYQITESNRYSLYNIKRKDFSWFNDIEVNDTNSFDEQQLGSFIGSLNNNNKRIILVDDEEDILFTYNVFLEEHNYNVTSFTDPSFAMNYIRNISNFKNLLVILDIRMKNLTGFQLHQQIKAIDPTIKVLFITALDILDEFSIIIPGISEEYIMKKPVDRKIFTSTIQKILK
jgi:PleD family two-component response regulator